jgi:triosephosphate isomerase (TIM)
MRERLAVGNWKMNPPTVAAAVELARAVARIQPERVSVGVAPPAVALAAVSEALQDENVAVFAQDVSWEDRGAFTGQIAASMLSGIAVGSIVGHSEVRRFLCEDDDRVAAKVRRVLGADLRVVLCVGESEEEFARDATDAVLDRQVRAVVGPANDPPTRDLMRRRLVIAYEPIWAIGTGRPATGAHASRAAAKIRNVLADEGLDADAVPVLYGGSVSATSVGEFARAPGIDGALVGGASLKVDEFGAIIRAFG